jgi:acetyltransferase-like isoleucine patch superfamily enzyme
MTDEKFKQFQREHENNNKRFMKKINKILSYIISRLPANFLRVYFYSRVSNIHIGYKVKLGYGTVLPITKLCSIYIGNYVTIGKNNEFYRGEWLNNFTIKKSSLFIGTNTEITKKHFFDLSGTITIGKNTIIGGQQSEFWTHGGKKPIKDISIGENCYIGSRTIFVPGAGIADNMVVGAGSIITKNYAEPGATIAGNPARIL